MPPLTPPLQLRRPPPSLRSIGCAALLRHHCAARSGRSLPLRGPFPATALNSWGWGSARTESTAEDLVSSLPGA